MEEAQTEHHSLNPHALEFHPSSSNNYPQYHHHNYSLIHNYPATANAAFFSPPPSQPPLLLLPHQHFQNYPYPTIPDRHHQQQYYYYYNYYYPKPVPRNTLPPPPLLHPPPPPPLPPPVAGRRRSVPGAGCNYGKKRGVIITRRKMEGQGHNGNYVPHHHHQGRVLDEGGERKSKNLGRRRIRERKNIPVKAQGLETTVMIKNIPNQYTRRMMMDFLDEFCKEENQRLVEDGLDPGVGQAGHQLVAYDFLYLPMDFKTDANKGYAFVNFTLPMAVERLNRACDKKRWKHCNSSKICRIACAAIQGKDNLREHFGSSRFICSKDEYLPVCFSPPRDGSGSTVTQTTVGERVKPGSRSRK